MFAETPNRIFVLSGGDLPDPRSSAKPVGRGQASNANHRPGNFVLVLNRDGQVVENWSQWDHLFTRPHKVTINPYDPEKHIWIVDDWAQQIFEFTNDGKTLVKTLGEKGVEREDQTHFGRPTDIAWLPDGSYWISDGYVNGRVVKYSREGKFVTSIGKKGAAAPASSISSTASSSTRTDGSILPIATIGAFRSSIRMARSSRSGRISGVLRTCTCSRTSTSGWATARSRGS